MLIRSIGDLAAAVRGRRIDLRLTQAQLAARAGVSRKWVYEFEAGKPSAELRLILRVLDALDLNLDLTGRVRGHETDKRRTTLDELIAEHSG